MSQGNDLDLERDLPLDAADRSALRLTRQTRVDPAEMQWQWISLALQFPRLCQSRETAVGREEFRLP